MIDLGLVSIDDLWSELDKRFDAYVYAYMQNLDNKKEASRVCYHGGKFTCLGLAKHIERKLLHDLNKDDEL